MVAYGLACPSPQSSATTGPWFFLGAALLDRIPCYTKTHYATHITAGWVLETCRVYVGEPSSSHLETSLQEAYPLPMSSRPNRNNWRRHVSTHTPSHLWNGVAGAAGIRPVQTTRRGAKQQCHRKSAFNCTIIFEQTSYQVLKFSH